MRPAFLAAPQHHALAGILLYSAGVFFFAVNDALGKWLVTDYSVAELMALRSVGALLVLAPALWRVRARLRAGPHRPGLQVLRILCSAVDTFCFYFATRSLPLADVMTFYLASPVIVVVLSALFLRERVGAASWLAVLVGFGGVMIALQPGAVALSGGTLAALLGSAMFAASIVITRGLREIHWLELVATQVIGTGLVGASGAPFAWVTPGLTDALLMSLVGIMSMACFACITVALGLTAASRLAPLQYASIVWAALMGWLVWGDVPSATLVTGIVVIVASGLLVLRPEAPRQAPAT